MPLIYFAKKETKIAPSKHFNKKTRRSRGQTDTSNTHLHDRPLSWIGTGTSIKSGGVWTVLASC